MGCNNHKTVLLFSGGLDSTVCLGVLLKRGYEVHPLMVDYGQNRREIQAAKKITTWFKTQSDIPDYESLYCPFPGMVHDLVIASIKFPTPIQSGVTGTMDLPSATTMEEVIRYDEHNSPVYVPARNMILASLAAGYAEQVGASSISLGIFSGIPSDLTWVPPGTSIPDQSEEFLVSLRETLHEGTRDKINLLVPIFKLNKVQIAKKALSLGLPTNLVWSCWGKGKNPCGKCFACVRLNYAFTQSGVTRLPAEKGGTV